MKYVSVCVLFMLFGCRDKESSLDSRLKAFMTKQWKSIDSTQTVENVHLLQMFNVTPKSQYIMRVADMNDSLIQYNKLLAEVNEITRNALLNNDDKAARESTNKAKRLAELSEDIQTRAKLLLKEAKTADSITVKDYQAIFVYRIRKADGSILKDTGNTILNRHFEIIPNAVYLSQLAGTIN